MAYSLSLDLVALAIQEVKKGNLVNASRLFVSAAQDESADKALRMIQATNEHALKVAAAAQAAAKAAPAKAAKPVKAAPAKALAGFEPTDASTMQVLKKLHAEAEDFVEEVEDEDGDDVVEDVVEEASAKPVNARVQAAAFAKVLATMQSNAKKAAPAKK
ncbi:hypothetical protein D3C87_1252410 [compost metagenome]